MTALDPEKRYRIGEFGALVGLSTYTLRYYEDEGLIRARRDENDQRYYTVNDIGWIGFLLHLKGTGMKLTELKQYVKWRAQGDQTIPQRRDLLEQVREASLAEIREREASLKVLSHKIDWYDGKLDHQIADNESFAEYLSQFSDQD
ncbi:MerR family transcriptional regulator [Levilactobacillus bambusae]|uniref:MerR family transcriptional regulator n=1 Tax=Levilactobacillus bambusae TaxID=2024736 RepID=A0A2V1MZB1_9LACO|nr:MerR family transcriptional regulator [Levilactobacillus bambusae]PWG00309.1 MerR family transcriptional regulator [Levilactobacillus bambusae]